MDVDLVPAVQAALITARVVQVAAAQQFGEEGVEVPAAGLLLTGSRVMEGGVGADLAHDTLPEAGCGEKSGGGVVRHG
ncbi:hypothetical protein [Streptomyces mirabilis]|uniref:hypothetical protein n=1 Tax=Streptomyces mirabilis TaxID=68239 RepID=UPI00382E3370